MLLCRIFLITLFAAKAVVREEDNPSRSGGITNGITSLLTCTGALSGALSAYSPDIVPSSPYCVNRASGGTFCYLPSFAPEDYFWFIDWYRSLDTIASSCKLVKPLPAGKSRRCGRNCQNVVFHGASLGALGTRVVLLCFQIGLGTGSRQSILSARKGATSLFDKKPSTLQERVKSRQEKVEEVVRARSRAEKAREVVKLQKAGVGLYKSGSLSFNLNSAELHNPEGLYVAVVQKCKKGVSSDFLLVPVAKENPAAVNLNYFLHALQMKRKGRAGPCFMLAPDEESGWHRKVFDPPHLAGTELGEALFNGDWFIKIDALNHIAEEWRTSIKKRLEKESNNSKRSATKTKNDSTLVKTLQNSLLSKKRELWISFCSTAVTKCEENERLLFLPSLTLKVEDISSMGSSNTGLNSNTAEKSLEALGKYYEQHPACADLMEAGKAVVLAAYLVQRGSFVGSRETSNSNDSDKPSLAQLADEFVVPRNVGEVLQKLGVRRDTTSGLLMRKRILNEAFDSSAAKATWPEDYPMRVPDMMKTVQVYRSSMDSKYDVFWKGRGYETKVSGGVDFRVKSRVEERTLHHSGFQKKSGTGNGLSAAAWREVNNAVRSSFMESLSRPRQQAK